MGAVYDGLAWASYKVLLKAYLYVDGTDFDTLLEELFSSAKRRADEYLNNPFETLVPTIVFASVVAGDSITVNGQDYTAAALDNEDEREFKVGATDTLTAAAFCALVNSTTVGGSYGEVGVPGVLATPTGASVALTRRYPNVTAIECTSSNDTKLLVRHVRTSTGIPEAVRQWVYQDVFRHFENRGAVGSEGIDGVGQKTWAGVVQGFLTNFDLISQYRLPVGF